MPTESQLQDAALRSLIRRRIDAGELPLVLSRTISVGAGSGLQCQACRQPIEPHHIEYHAFGVKYGAAVRLHWGCHVLWQLECVERSRRQSGSSRAPPEPQAQSGPDAETPKNLTRWDCGLAPC